MKKTIAKLYHKYRLEDQFEQGEVFQNMTKLPHCICYYYGHDARIHGDELHQRMRLKKVNPIEFLIEKGFSPVTDDTWQLIHHE